VGLQAREPVQGGYGQDDQQWHGCGYEGHHPGGHCVFLVQRVAVAPVLLVAGTINHLCREAVRWGDILRVCWFAGSTFMSSDDLI